MCIGMANGGKSLTEELRKNSAIKNTNGIIECDLDLVCKTIQKFTVKVVEEQENIIMRTIQYIGGDEYSHITIDKNKVVDAFRKYTPTKPTHEASLYKCFTCPTCKNVIDEFTDFAGKRVRVTFDNCKFCGQALDWSDTDEQNDVITESH